MCEFGESGTWEVSLVGTSVEGGRTTRFVRSYIVVENQEAFVDVLCILDNIYGEGGPGTDCCADVE